MDLFSLPFVLPALLLLWVAAELLFLAVPTLRGGFSLVGWAHAKLTGSIRVPIPAHLDRAIAGGRISAGAELKVVRDLTWTDDRTVAFCVRPEDIGVPEGSSVRILRIGRRWMWIREVGPPTSPSPGP